MWWSAKMSCSHADCIFEAECHHSPRQYDSFLRQIYHVFVMLALEFPENLLR
jgi:hypothetical protein